MTYAVIDVGSNSVLLTVCSREGSRWLPILETSKVTGLGRGTKQTGLLHPEAISDTLAAVHEAWQSALEAGATEVRAYATMAARIATNTPEFLAAAIDQGTPIEVLSGEDEAALGLLAVTRDPVFGKYERIAVVDVGGHSTEIAIAFGAEFSHQEVQVSLPVGTLGLIAGDLSEECPGPSALLRASSAIDAVILAADLKPIEGAVVALGATGTNLVTLRDQIVEWDPERVHGAELSYEEVGRAVGYLSSIPLAQRAELPGMEPGREGTIHAGSLILERCLFALKAEGCFVSVRGWRHAILENFARKKEGFRDF